MSFLVNSNNSFCSSLCSHESQFSSLSWQYVLLFPFWVRAHSSPARSIGTPGERKSVAKKFRCCLARNSFTSGPSLGPSTPQFNELLLVSPSLFSSPLASLSFCLLLTRSFK